MANTPKAGGTRKAATNRGRTTAAVDKDLKEFKNEVSSRFDGLEAGLANIANLLSDQRAQQLNDEVQASVQYDEAPAQQVGEIRLPAQQFEEEWEDVGFEDDFEDDEYDDDPEPVVDPRDFQQRGYARPRRNGRKGRTPVGQRPGDKIIRNLHPNPLRLRLGKPSDPYRVNLEARGEPGDVDQIPRSLVNDLGYKRNLNRSFEEITEDEFNALTEHYAGLSTGGYQGGYTDAELVMDEDRTIYDSSAGGIQYDVNDPRTWPGHTHSGLGPKILDTVGSDRQVSSAVRDAYGQTMDADDQAEFEIARRRMQGLLPPDPRDPSGAQAMAKLKRKAAIRRQAQRQLAGQDRESQIMAQRIRALEQGGRAGRSEVGVLPQGELDKPVRLVRGQEAVVSPRGVVQQGVPGRRIPTENVPQVPQRRR
jgi:hypothetical protein